MTVNVDVAIPVPPPTDTYNLITDLNLMRAGIEESINDIIIELQSRPETGQSASFSTITVTGSGRFGSLVVSSTGGGSDLIINNSPTQYGLSKAGAGSLLYKNNSWVSSSPVAIVDPNDPVNTLQLATQEYVASQVAVEATARTTADTTITGKMAVKAIGAGYDNTWVQNAVRATKADTLTGGVPTHTHTNVYAPAANRPEIFYGWYAAGNSFTIAAGAESLGRNITLPSGKSEVYPAWIGVTVYDCSNDVVVASIGSGWSDPHIAPLVLKNVGGGSETVRVRWAAIYA